MSKYTHKIKKLSKDNWMTNVYKQNYLNLYLFKIPYKSVVATYFSFTKPSAESKGVDTVKELKEKDNEV